MYTLGKGQMTIDMSMSGWRLISDEAPCPSRLVTIQPTRPAGEFHPEHVPSGIRDVCVTDIHIPTIRGFPVRREISSICRD